MSLDISSFESIFGNVPKSSYPTSMGDDIINAQSFLGGQILFHMMLDSLNIKATHLYPPRNATDFEELHRHIVKDEKDPEPEGQQQQEIVTEVQRMSLLFYLLKDCDLVYSQSTSASQPRGKRRREEAEEWAKAFAEKVHLPVGHQMGIEAYWLLDKLKIREAFSYVMHPSTNSIVKSTFNEVVLWALINSHLDSLALQYHVWPGARLDNGPSGLKTALYRLKASANLTEALYFWRNRSNGNEKKDMLKVLVDAALDCDNREEAIEDMVRFPFTAKEERIFIEVLTDDEQLAKKKVRKSGATETLALRDLAKYRYKSAVKRIIGMEHATTEERAKWEVILTKIKESGSH